MAVGRGGAGAARGVEAWQEAAGAEKLRGQGAPGGAVGGLERGPTGPKGGMNGHKS